MVVNFVRACECVCAVCDCSSKGEGLDFSNMDELFHAVFSFSVVEFLFVGRYSGLGVAMCLDKNSDDSCRKCVGGIADKYVYPFTGVCKGRRYNSCRKILERFLEALGRK